jgi:hypothetical protein
MPGPDHITPAVWAKPYFTTKDTKLTKKDKALRAVHRRRFRAEDLVILVVKLKAGLNPRRLRANLWPQVL